MKKRNIFKKVVFILILISIVFITFHIIKELRHMDIVDRLESDSIEIETNVIVGDLVSARLILDDDHSPETRYYVNVRIEGQIFTINDEMLYNEFLHDGKLTELFVVYDKVGKNKNDEKIRIERTIYSIFK